jgi:hypothetical protein
MQYTISTQAQIGLKKECQSLQTAFPLTLRDQLSFANDVALRLKWTKEYSSRDFPLLPLESPAAPVGAKDAASARLLDFHNGR